MEKAPTQELQRAARPAEERAAATWNLTSGVHRHGPAFAAFAEAIGHLAAIRDPELFWSSRVGIWPNMDAFVSQYVEEAGLSEQLDCLPDTVRPFATIDHGRVADDLRSQLVVVEVDERVWVFDARREIDNTVAKRER